MLPIYVGSWDIYMYDVNDAKTMMNASEIREAIVAEIKNEVVRFVMDDKNGFYGMFDHSTWHDDEGRLAHWRGTRGKCTYEKAIEILTSRKIKFFNCTHMEIHVREEQYNDVEIHSLLLSSCYKTYVHDGRYYGLARDTALPCIGNEHIKKFLNIDLVSPY